MLNNEMSAETKAEKSTNAEVTNVSPAIGNTDVVCSQSPKITEVPWFTYLSEENDKLVFDYLDEREQLQLASIVGKLYHAGIKLKIIYRIFK